MIFVCSRLKKKRNFVYKNDDYVNFVWLLYSPINIFAMVYIMYFILFQCIRMIESEKIYMISMIFCKIVNLSFLA